MPTLDRPLTARPISTTPPIAWDGSVWMIEVWPPATAVELKGRDYILAVRTEDGCIAVARWLRHASAAR